MLKFNNGKLQESYSMAESSRTCIIDLQVNQGYGKFFEIGLKIKSLKKDWLFTPSLCYPYPCEGRT